MSNFEGSSRILDIREDFILISVSTSINPGNIYVYNCKTEEHNQIKVTPINSNSTLEKEIERSHENSVIELNSNVHVVLLKPKSTGKQKLPLIMIPHGGPNSVYSGDYGWYPVVFARLGLAVASSNFKEMVGLFFSCGGIL